MVAVDSASCDGAASVCAVASRTSASPVSSSASTEPENTTVCAVEPDVCAVTGWSAVESTSASPTASICDEPVLSVSPVSSLTAVSLATVSAGGRPVDGSDARRRSASLSRVPTVMVLGGFVPERWAGAAVLLARCVITPSWWASRSTCALNCRILALSARLSA